MTEKSKPSKCGSNETASCQQNEAVPIGSDNDLDFKDVSSGLTSRDEISEDDAPKGLVGYEDRVVAFIDILGFSELIRKSSNEPDSVSQIVDALRVAPQAYRDGKLYPDAGVIISTFSDCIVLSAPNTEDGYIAIIFMVWEITKDWLSKGFLSRGGISQGKLVHTRAEDGVPSIVFGPAFLDAYRIEHQISNYSRVLLSQSARIKIQSFDNTDNAEFAKKFLKQCPDGPWTIDIFAHLRFDEFRPEDWANEAKQFKQALERQKAENSDTPHHFSKIKWIIDEFNHAISDSSLKELTIDLLQ